MADLNKLDQDTVNTIYNKFLFTSKPLDSKQTVIEKPTVVALSNNLTALQNSFNDFATSISNINKLDQYKIKRQNQLNLERTIEGSSSSELTGSSVDYSIIINGFGLLSNQLDNLIEKFSLLDMSPSCPIDQMDDDEDGISILDDDDSRRRRRRSRRGRTRGFRTRLPRLSTAAKFGGKALGVLGVGLDIYQRQAEGQTVTQTAVGVGGGLAGAAVGAQLGAAAGAPFAGVGAVPGAAIGGFLGGIIGYFGGSALADRGYETATSKELSETSYSSRFADYLQQITSSALISAFPTAGAIAGGLGSFFGGGQGVGSSENAEKAIAFFMSSEGGSYTREQAAGIVGNLQGESGKNLNPSAVGDSGNAYGIAQWNQKVSPDRVANFRKVIGTDLRNSTFEQQLKFIAWELQNTEKSAGSKLRAANDIESATVAMSQYERYRGYKAGLGSSETQKRIANARALFQPTARIPDGQSGSKRVTSGFGMRFHPVHKQWRMHKGIDIAAPKGTPVYSLQGGVVKIARPVSGYGNVVYVKQDNGFEVRYAHLSSILVGEGSRITKDQIVGLVGSTGVSSGPHLHFEIRDSADKPLDPINVYNSNKWIVGGKTKEEQLKPEAKVDPRFLKQYDGVLMDPKKRKTIIIEKPVYITVPVKNGKLSRAQPPISQGMKKTDYYA